MVEAGKRDSEHGSIADSTTAVVFLGVPHQGFNGIVHRIGASIGFLLKPFGSRTDLLDLAAGSSGLDELHYDFLKMYGRINCACFFECVPECVFGVDIGTV